MTHFFLYFFSLNFVFADLKTIAEKSNWLRTGDAQETAKLCQEFQRKFPARVECRTYGKTPEGRSLHYLLIQDQKKISAPTLWFQAGIHAGEIDGKDAFFWLLREVLEKKLTPDPFKGLRVVFVPIVNLDGHERRGPWNRPNQVGPEEMGWRTTSENYNLNRDFMKVDSAEMRDLLRLWGKMDPIVSLDLHVTNGAQFQPEVGVVINPNQSHGATALHQAGQLLEDELMKKMKDRGRLALPFYPTFEVEEEPLSGFSRYVSSPRFSQGYWYVRNRIGVLVESHSWKSYDIRVKTHRDTILSVLEIAQSHAKTWTQEAKKIDQVSLSGQAKDLAFKNTEKSRRIDFAGYKFKKEISKISGGPVVRYFPDQPEIWKVPFFEELVPALTVIAPKEGYFVPVQEAPWIKVKLDVHGIRYKEIKKAETGIFQVFRAFEAKMAAGSFEGHQILEVKGEWKDEKVLLQVGALFVPINQPGGQLAMQLFEPMAKDSLLSWGFLNRYFEKKEYMEDYVAEDVAREMLLRDPKVKEEFEKKLKDPEFAKDSNKRFEFFHQKHPSWDTQFNRYPILRR